MLVEIVSSVERDYRAPKQKLLQDNSVREDGMTGAKREVLD